MPPLSDQSNRAPTSTIVGSSFAILAAFICCAIWLEVKHAGRGWIVGAVLGVVLWAAFWLDYVQRRAEGRM